MTIAKLIQIHCNAMRCSADESGFMKALGGLHVSFCGRSRLTSRPGPRSSLSEFWGSQQEVV
jgi:hypothetical protein